MDVDQPKRVTVRVRKIARKKIFAECVAARQKTNNPPEWTCCNHCFKTAVDIHKHVSLEHHAEIESRTTSFLEESLFRKKHYFEDNGKEESNDQVKFQEQCGNQIFCSSKNGVVCKARDYSYSEDDVRPWLPMVKHEENDEEVYELNNKNKEGQVLLFYRYIDLENPEDIYEWQRELCRRLQLHGKIRIAREGLNGTVGGEVTSTEQYIEAVMAHPCFSDMKTEDFKTSPGGRDSFPDGLVVSIHQEIVPMGVDPLKISFKDAGRHLTPTQFHEEVLRHRNAKETGQETDTVFIDCRNFYESKIGIFPDAVTPDIRKFSYWPEYVDKNEALFADKKILMYCTGGIRCERGSAYLRSKGICKEVLQLEGGIHRYLDQFPEGFFRGKLFVFDNRYSIQTNQDVIAECFHCSSPWDSYEPCSSKHCHQLVLSCPACRTIGLTTCCRRCAELANDYTPGQDGKVKKRKEECTCTKNRERIPVEKMGSNPLDTSKNEDYKGI